MKPDVKAGEACPMQSVSAVQRMQRPIRAGPRQYLSLHGATALHGVLKRGPSPLIICHFCIHSFYLVSLFRVHVTLSITSRVSPSQQERKPLTDVGHFMLVCNIVYVPIVAPYPSVQTIKRGKLMYRLCDW